MNLAVGVPQSTNLLQHLGIGCLRFVCETCLNNTFVKPLQGLPVLSLNCKRFLLTVFLSSPMPFDADVSSNYRRMAQHMNQANIER